MATSGTWNITPAHGNRTVLTVTSAGFDFPGKNSVRYRIFDREGGRALVTILETDTNGMTRASGTLTLTLDSNVATLPNLTAIWTTLGPRRYYHELEIRNSASEDYHKVFGGTVTFQGDGSAGTENASASFTYSDGATNTTMTVALGDAKKHNFAASVAPAVTDDADAGYSVGSLWAGTTINPYFCTNPAAGAAVWVDLTAASIADGSITLAKLADLAQNRVIGRITAGTGVPESLTAANVRTIINVADGADVTGSNPPQAHAASHVGADAIQNATAGQAGLMTAAFASKLDGIEAAADVTDATNVAAAGAAMTSTYDPAGAAAQVKVIGKETLPLLARAWQPTTTAGCAALAQVETTAGRPDIEVLDFDGATLEAAQIVIPFPKGWNEGTITFKVFWTVTAAVTTGVAWQLKAVAISDDDTLNVVYGTAVVVTDTALNASNDLHVTAESSAVTIAGTPAEGDLVYFRIERDPAHASDTMTQDARLLAVHVYFTTNAANDA